jgi:rubrerythrin
MIDQSKVYIELKSREVKIEFTKKDGTQRSMLCTLNEAVIPTEKLPKSKEETSDSISSEICRVFDVEKQDWRSFRWDSVIEVV